MKKVINFGFVAFVMAFSIVVVFAEFYLLGNALNLVKNLFHVDTWVLVVLFFVSCFTVVIDSCVYVVLNISRVVGKWIRYEVEIDKMKYQSVAYAIYKSYKS